MRLPNRFPCRWTNLASRGNLLHTSPCYPLACDFIQTGEHMSKPLKVAVIGTGGISRTHMPGWEASPYTEVVAAADVNAAALEDFGSKFGVEKLYTDTNDIFGDPTIDIVDICTPNRLHTPLVLSALAAGT